MTSTHTAATLQATSPLSALLEIAGAVAVHMDAKGFVTFSSRSVENAHLHAALVAGIAFTSLFEESERDAVAQSLDEALATGGQTTLIAPMRNDLGVALRWRLCAYSAESRHGLIAVGTDITAEKEAELQLSYSSLYDALTGLPNESLLGDRCSQAVALFQRNQQGFSLAVLTLTGVHKVNEGFGLQAGEQLIKDAAHRLQQTVRGSDTIARIGNADFALLLSESMALEDIERLCSKVINTLEAPYSVGAQSVHLGACLGYAVFPEHAKNYQDLRAASVQALHQAQAHGTGVFERYSAASAQDSKAHLSLEAALHEGVSNGELYLDYQPLVNAQDGSIYGVESLMRWKQGGVNQVSPAQFIPIAEACGLIHLLGAWALKVSTVAIAQFNKREGTALEVSVNVSPRQFRGPLFIRSLHEALALSGLAPAQLQLEITEGTLMNDPLAATELLDQIAAMGVKIALDDFGTGYSSLAYLKRFTLSTLKIDRSFVKDLPNVKDLAICKNVFSLAHELGLKSLAEGVETQAQWHILRDAGVRAIQGYYFGKPASLKELAVKIRAPLPGS